MQISPWQHQCTGAGATCSSAAQRQLALTRPRGVSQKPWLITLVARGSGTHILQVRRWQRLGFLSHAVTISRFSSPMSLLLCLLRGYMLSVTQTVPHQRKTCLLQRFNRVCNRRILEWKEMGPNQEGRYLLLKQLYQNSRWIMMWWTFWKDVLNGAVSKCFNSKSSISALWGF